MKNIELLSKILDSLPVFIGLVDQKQQYEYVNATYVARYNLPREEIIGKTVRELNGEAEYSRSKPQIEAALRGERVKFEYSFEDSFFIIDYLPRVENEKVTGYFVISSDITELRHANNEIEKNMLELQSLRSSFENFASLAHYDRIASVGAMAVGLAHDISQPISAINILMDSLKIAVKGSIVEQSAIGMINQIQHQVQFAASIINRLRSFSSHKTAERQETNFNETIADALAMMRPRLSKNNVKLVKDLNDCESKGFVDGIEIQQVLVNLIANAIDSVCSHDQYREIRVESELVDDRYFYFRIIDNGPGISGEMIDRIFETFETDKPTGCGIGLSISKSLVERNGGILFLDEECQAGTSFVCRFPVLVGVDATSDS